MASKEIKHKMINFLKYFDGFGESHTFRVNTEKAYNSPVGGFFCLLFIVYTFYYIAYTFKDFYNGEYKSKEFDTHIIPHPSINLTYYKDFSIAFCLRKENYLVDKFMTQNVETKVFYAEDKLDVNKKLIKIEQEVPLSDCSFNFGREGVSQHRKKYWKLLNSFDMQGCKCLNFDSTFIKNFNLTSNLEGVEKDYFLMKLQYSQGDGSEYTKQYISENNPKMHIYFPEYSTEISDNEDPVQVKMHIESFQLAPKVTQVSEILFGVLSFTDYYSYTQDEIFISKNKLVFDSKTEYMLNSLQDNTLLKLSFTLKGKKTTYIRNFLKIQDYLSNVIGYLWNIILIVYIVSWIYNCFGSQRFLLEKFFLRNKSLRKFIQEQYSEFSDLKSKRRKKIYGKEIKKEIDKEKINFIEMEGKAIVNEKLAEKIDHQEGQVISEEKRLGIEEIEIVSPLKQVCSVSNLNNFGENLNNNSDLHPEPNINNNFLPQDKIIKNNFSIFFYDYIYQYIVYLFCPGKQKKKNYELYQSTENFYNYYMDISVYLKMMIEFEIIKSLVLSSTSRRFLKKFKPFLKRIHNYEYKSKLAEFYKSAYDKKDVDAIFGGIQHFAQNKDFRALKTISKFI